MALQAGRVGVASDQVDIFGKIDLPAITEAVKQSLAENCPIIAKKWYYVKVSSDGTDYSGETNYPTGSLEFHTDLVLLPAGVVPKGYVVGVNQRKTGGSSTTVLDEGLQYGYSSTASTRCGFRIPGKTVLFDLIYWFCVD